VCGAGPLWETGAALIKFMKPNQDIVTKDKSGMTWVLHAGSGCKTVEQAKQKAIAAAEKIIAMASKMPPWAAFPSYARGCMGFRMGDGETFWLAWMDRWQEMTDEQRSAYIKKWPTPEGWGDFYDYATRICDCNAD